MPIELYTMNFRGTLAMRAGIAGILITSFGCGSKSAETSIGSTAAASSSTAARGTAVVTGKVNGSGAGAVVVLAPADGHEVPPPAGLKVMDQAGYEFLPPLLVAQAGQAVQFRNSEDVLHNVRVTEVATDTPVFNVATIAFGSYDYKFERPGFYTVTCDIHSSMRADILVSPSPYTAKTDQNGGFAIDGVPTGAYTVTLYAGGAPTTKAVEVKSGKTELDLP
jgi:plastocyanin